MTDTTADLGRALRALGEHGDRLTLFAASPEQLDEIGRDLDGARRLLAAVRAEQGLTGCRQHPAGPVDLAAGGGCLLCSTARRRGQLPVQGAAPAEVPLTEICREVAEHGQEAAVLRHGARTVTRALLHCRNEPDLTEESA